MTLLDPAPSPPPPPEAAHSSTGAYSDEAAWLRAGLFSRKLRRPPATA